MATVASRDEQKPLLSIEQKVEAFLAYLELDNYDMLRYHMQACGKLMDEAPLVRHATREGKQIRILSPPKSKSNTKRRES